MVSDLISSEDSDENDSIVVKPLPWRAPKVTDFFKFLLMRTKLHKLNVNERIV